MAIEYCTSWDDLDWEDINPWDKRYYLSLIDAILERYHVMPLTPAEGNSPYATQVTYHRYSVKDLGAKVDRRYWEFLAPYMAFGCRRITELFLELAFGNYFYYYRRNNNAWDTTADYKKKWCVSPYDYQPYRFHPSGDYEKNILSLTDFCNDVDTVGIWGWPMEHQPFGGEITTKWLKAMKKAIQKLRYFEIFGSCFPVWNGYNVTKNPYYFTWGEVEALAAQNVNATYGDALAHDYQNDSAMISYRYRRLEEGSYFIEFQKRDIIWQNQLSVAVDVYAIARNWWAPYDYNSNPIAFDHFNDFGSGYVEGAVYPIGKVSPGETIGNFLTGISPIPDIEHVVHNYSSDMDRHGLELKLIADAGAYFNFKS